jgi:DNA-binding PucR family transcriptional regulator
MMFRTLAPLFFTTSTAVAEGVDAMSTGSEMSLAGLSDEDRELVEALMALVSAELSERLPEVTRGMRGVLSREITALADDNRLLELLGGAIEGNVGTILHILRHRIPMRDVDVPSAAVAHARRLAQTGVAVNSLVRAYRLGQTYLLEQCFAELDRRAAEPRLSLLAFNEINVRVFAYIDWMSQEVVTVYETERDQWVRNRDTVRVAHIKEMVAGRSRSDIASAEAALGFRLRQHHVAAVLWVDDDADATDSVARLEACVSLLGRELCGSSAPLSCAADRSSVWVWFPRGVDADDPDIQRIGTVLGSERTGGVRAALGGSIPGMDGFRDSHLQAIEAQRVLLTGGDTARKSIGYREPGVAAAALLAHNLDQTRLLVRSALGPLDADDVPSARLRETLLVFLASGSSYTATAQRSAMHKNTVKYRVERALELRGRPLGEDRIDVELALVACRWLRGGLLGAEAQA